MKLIKVAFYILFICTAIIIFLHLALAIYHVLNFPMETKLLLSTIAHSLVNLSIAMIILLFLYLELKNKEPKELKKEK